MKNYYSETIKCIDAGIFAINCGAEACKPSHSFGPYVRDHYLIHYIQKGVGKFEINNKTYYPKEGDIFFIPPRIITYYEADKINPWTYKWIGFYGKNISNIFLQAGLSPETPVKHVEKNISNIIDAIIDLSQTFPDNQIKFVSHIYNFFDTLLENGYKTITHKNNSELYIEKAINYIWQYIYKKITVAELSAYINVDRSYLTSIFKQHTGLSPQQYIMEIKMKTACEYLEQTNYEITQIAQSVGYEDLFVFSHAFKNFTGLSPKKYREKYFNK